MTITTRIEADRKGNPLRIYHRTQKWTWTHGLETRKTCPACTDGRLPSTEQLDKMKADNP